MSVRAFFAPFFLKKNQDLGGAKGDFANKAKWSSNPSCPSRIRGTGPKLACVGPLSRRKTSPNGHKFLSADSSRQALQLCSYKQPLKRPGTQQQMVSSYPHFHAIWPLQRRAPCQTAASCSSGGPMPRRYRRLQDRAWPSTGFAGTRRRRSFSA